jgi:hypothetical protein
VPDFGLMPKGLTQSWIAAEATLPPDWGLTGVALGPRKVDPQIRSESWVAWARGPNGQRADGQGESPAGALDALANAMRKNGQAFHVE